MSDVYEPLSKSPGPGPKAAPTPTARKAQTPHRARVKADENVLGNGPEVMLETVPKGRTAKVEEAIAATMRGDEGMAPTLKAWGEGLNKAAEHYGENRQFVSELYIAHSTQESGGPVAHLVHAERKVALGVEYGLYTRLAADARTVATLSAPTLTMLELADRSYKELMLSMERGGRAKADRGDVIVDGGKVQSEGRFHLEQVKEDGLQDRSKAPAEKAHMLSEKYTAVVGALKLASSGNAELRQQAFQSAASENEGSAQKLEAQMVVFDWVDKALGSFSNVAGIGTAIAQGDPAGAITSGGGLLTAIARALSGDQIGKLRAQAAAQMDLAGTEQAKSAADRIDAFLEGLEVALAEFLHHAECSLEGQADHVESRRRDGVQLDRAARQRAELGPLNELHVPIATRLARIETALAYNRTAQAATSRYIGMLITPASLAEELRLGRTNQGDLAELRSNLPKNIYRSIVGKLIAVRNELVRRATSLKALEVKG